MSHRNQLSAVFSDMQCRRFPSWTSRCTFRHRQVLDSANPFFPGKEGPDDASESSRDHIFPLTKLRACSPS